MRQRLAKRAKGRVNGDLSTFDAKGWDQVVYETQAFVRWMIRDKDSFDQIASANWANSATTIDSAIW